MKLFFPPFPQTLEIDNADFHIPTPRRPRGSISLKTTALRDTHSEGKVIARKTHFLSSPWPLCQGFLCAVNEFRLRSAYERLRAASTAPSITKPLSLFFPRLLRFPSFEDSPAAGSEAFQFRQAALG